jgi:uncharacterized OsmC-like protein
VELSLRVSASPKTGSATAFTRKHQFTVGAPVAFDEQDPHISALEYVLGGLGAELVTGLLATARARHQPVDHAEAVVKGELDDPLAHIGVVGATGSPALARVSIKVYASGDDEAALRDLWKLTLERSPLVHTLEKTVRLDIELVVLP